MTLEQKIKDRRHLLVQSTMRRISELHPLQHKSTHTVVLPGIPIFEGRHPRLFVFTLLKERIVEKQVAAGLKEMALD